MSLRPHRPCNGKGSGDAHDEEELYFHCELSVPHGPPSSTPSQLSPPVTPAMRHLSSGALSLSVLSQSPDTPHVSRSPELWRPVAGCASVRQGARCQKRHPGEELGSRQALDPRSLDSPGSSAHWINPTHQATPTGGKPCISAIPHLLSASFPHQFPLMAGSPASARGYPFPERRPSPTPPPPSPPSTTPTRGVCGSVLPPLLPRSPWDTCLSFPHSLPRGSQFSPRLFWDRGRGLSSKPRLTMGELSD